MVIAVIGLLAALLIPAVNGALEKSRDAKSASNLRQIGLALNGFASENNNFYPKASGVVAYQAEGSDPATWSWQQQIDDYVAGTRAVFQSPHLPFAQFGYGYYLGGRAAYLDAKQNGSEGGERFAPVNRLRIRELSKHILGGECVYWGGQLIDADKDDYSQTPSFKPDGSKGKLTPILFADGHVQSFAQFDNQNMTGRYEGVGDGNSYPSSP